MEYVDSFANSLKGVAICLFPVTSAKLALILSTCPHFALSILRPRAFSRSRLKRSGQSVAAKSSQQRPFPTCIHQHYGQLNALAMRQSTACIPSQAYPLQDHFRAMCPTLRMLSMRKSSLSRSRTDALSGSNRLIYLATCTQAQTTWPQVLTIRIHGSIQRLRKAFRMVILYVDCNVKRSRTYARMELCRATPSPHSTQVFRLALG